MCFLEVQNLCGRPKGGGSFTYLLLVIRCALLQLYEQYDDEEIGALDQDEIAGYVPPESEVLQQALQEFEGLQNAG